MAKIDPFRLTRPVPVEESKTFTDALQPGFSLPLTMRSDPDYGAALKVQDLSARYVDEFVGADKVPIQAGGRNIEIGDRLCVVIAIIQTLEKPQEDGDRYSFQEWAAFSVVAPNAFGEVVEWASGLMGKATAPDSETVPNV